MCAFFRAAQRRDLFGRREQRADLDVEAEVGEGGGDDLLAAVVAVLAHLGDENARRRARRSPRTRASSRCTRSFASPRAPGGLEIDARDGLRLRDMPVEDLLERQADFANRSLGAGRRDGQVEQIALAPGALGQPRQSPGQRPAPSRSARKTLQLVDLLATHVRGIVDLQDIDPAARSRGRR